jgi:hypothetical protein
MKLPASLANVVKLAKETLQVSLLVRRHVWTISGATQLISISGGVNASSKNAAPLAAMP